MEKWYSAWDYKSSIEEVEVFGETKTLVEIKGYGGRWRKISDSRIIAKDRNDVVCWLLTKARDEYEKHKKWYESAKDRLSKVESLA